MGAWRDIAQAFADNEPQGVAFSVAAPVAATRELVGSGDDPTASLLGLRNRGAERTRT